MKNYFEHISGNDHVKDYLINMVEKKAIGNSLLFAGPEEASKDQFAIALAKILMGEQAHAKIDTCNHPDLHHYYPEGKIGMHSIASMRQFSEEVYLPPYENSWKIFIIHYAERMLPYSANALLKTFEEPSLDTIIILLSCNQNALLPTIRSRCRTIYFQSGLKKVEKEQVNSLRIKILSLLAKGKMKTYTELQQSAVQIAEHMDEVQKKEGELKTERQKISVEQLNASQRQAAEKEMEGMVSVGLNQHAKAVLKFILSWYRDMHLIHAGASLELMENPDFQSAIFQAYQRGELLPLESVEKKIKEAILSFERSTAFNLCLEKLFLEFLILKE